MVIVLDSRTNKNNKSSDNRRKFLNRIRTHIKKAIPEVIGNKNVKDLANNPRDIKISKKLLSEPTFIYKPGKEETYILPGNTDMVRGDRMNKRMSGGDGGGHEGSPEDDDSKDNFIIRLTNEEFLNYFFDDLQLPDLIKKNLLTTKTFENKNAGYLLDGPPGRLAIIRSLKNAYLRRVATVGMHKKKLKELENEEEDEELLVKKQILEKKIKKVPYIDTIDLRYRNSIRQYKPATTATIFSITDCSGSMTEEKKLISRKFFYLLYLFLIRKYETVNLVWIIHTAEAREVTEKEFFETQESGGTVISTALELVYNLIQEKYNSTENNLYILQSSDGDNFSVDNLNVSNYLDKLLPLVQFYGYIQIDDSSLDFSSSNIFDIYLDKTNNNKNLQCKKITNEREIWPMFRSLFEKDE